MEPPPSEPALDDVIRAAWEVTQEVIDVRDELSEPSDAFAFLTNGVRELAERRTISATAECAKRFEIVSGWMSSQDAAASGRLAVVAAQLRALGTPG